MKKKKVKKVEIGKKKKYWFSRNRYQDSAFNHSAKGEKIVVFDVVKNEVIEMSVKDWEILKKVKISSIEYNIYYERLVTYWEGRKS